MILVTGGTGLVGSHLLFHLLQKEEKVRALKRSASLTENVQKIFSYYTANAQKLFSKIEWVDGDVLDIYTLLDAMEGIDRVYHTAAMVSFHPSDEDELMAVNIAGTAHVVNACLEKKVKKLCHVSSVAALGRAENHGMTTENNDWLAEAAHSPYARSKFEAEREVWRGMAEGLKAVIVNPSIILGPANFDKGSAKMFQTVYNGLKVYTPGANGYVDVNDVARAMILLMESNISGERFILNGENLHYKQLFQMMAKALDVKAPKYRAGKLLSEITWRVMKISTLLTGKQPLITRQTAKTANSVYAYSSEKFIRATGMHFTPLTETISHTAKIFLSRQ